MLVVILGAGASFDSVDLNFMPLLRQRVLEDAVYRPPLANELFAERSVHIKAMNAFDAAAPLIPGLRKAAAESGAALETELRILQERSAGYPPLQRALLAIKFYLQQICNDPINEWVRAAGRATNYGALVMQIGQWAARVGEQVAYITFNYDLMLDHAFTGVYGRRFTDLDHYIDQEDACLLKPHGSVDWIEYVHSPDGRTHATPDLIANADRLIYNGHFDHRGSHRAGTAQLSRIPALAIPVDATKTFVCPQSHLDRMRGCLQTASRVLVIGWRASEAHFLEELRNCTAQELAVVDGRIDGIRSVRINMQNGGASLGTASGQLGWDRGFSRFVVDGGLTRWLAGDLIGDPGTYAY